MYYILLYFKYKSNKDLNRNSALSVPILISSWRIVFDLSSFSESLLVFVFSRSMSLDLGLSLYFFIIPYSSFLSASSSSYSFPYLSRASQQDQMQYQVSQKHYFSQSLIWRVLTLMVRQLLDSPEIRSNYFILLEISGLSLWMDQQRVFSLRQSSVIWMLSLEMYSIERHLASLELPLVTNDEMNSFPISYTLPATVFTLSSIFDFSSYSPFISENSAEPSNKNNLNCGVTLSFSFINSESKYFFSLLIRYIEQSFPYIFSDAQKFFSGRTGMIRPGQRSKRSCCRNQKSLKRRFTSVVSPVYLDLEQMVQSLQEVMQPSEITSIQSSMVISRPSRNLMISEELSLPAMSRRLVLWSLMLMSMDQRSRREGLSVLLIQIWVKKGGLGTGWGIWGGSQSSRRLICWEMDQNVGQDQGEGQGEGQEWGQGSEEGQVWSSNYSVVGYCSFSQRSLSLIIIIKI